MCGFIFYHSLNKAIKKENFLKAINDLQHRGPDGMGTWVSQQQTTALGHRRLSVNGGRLGHQPLISADKRWIAAVNGEFYNSRQSLVKQGVKFTSASDSEYLLQSFMTRGADCLAELDGEFAFAIWDQLTQTAYLARDRHGIKPLYFAQFNGQTIAASEIKALLTYGIPARWNKQYLSAAGSFVIDANETFVEGVYSVQPGELLTITSKGLKRNSYLQQSPLDPSLYPTSHLSFAQACDEFECLFIGAVQKRLHPTFNNACYLSSGVDSAMVTAIAAKYSGQINAFSIGFDDPQLDESKKAEHLAKQLGVNHHIIQATDQLLADNFEEAIYHCEAPVPNINVSAKLLLSKTLAKHGHKIALTGEGADESLLGYHFLKHDITSPYNDINKLSKIINPHLLFVYNKLGYIPSQIIQSAPQARVLNSLQEKQELGINPYLALMESISCHSPTIPSTSQKIHYQSAFQNYNLGALADRTEMANGVEGRPPFLDNKLVNFIHSLPTHFKFDQHVDKRILRHVAEKYLPKQFSSIEKKPFIAPVSCMRNSGPLFDFFNHYFLDESHLPAFYSMEKVRLLYGQLLHLSPAKKAQFDPIFMHLASLMVLQKRFSLTF